MKPSKTSKQWMREHINDPFVQLAQKDGYRSRAAYKLLEINEKDQLLKAGMGDGKHSFLIPTPAVLLDGNTHVVSVKYAGKTLALYTSPKSLSCQSSTTTLNSTPTPVLAGQTLTLSALVAASTGVPTGAVSFLEGNTLLGSANLVNGKASTTLLCLRQVGILCRRVMREMACTRGVWGRMLQLW